MKGDIAFGLLFLAVGAGVFMMDIVARNNPKSELALLGGLGGVFSSPRMSIGRSQI
jgi:hypothetical protein